MENQGENASKVCRYRMISWRFDGDEYVSPQNHQMKIFTSIYADYVRMGRNFGCIYLSPVDKLN